MTQEEKELLLLDLCARLPYRVFVHTWYNKPLDIRCTGVDIYTNTIRLDLPDDYYARVYIDNVKPYLRPMSSMTIKEIKEYSEMTYKGSMVRFDVSKKNHNMFVEVDLKHLDWLNAHHFDYRGLIEKGLALEAPEGMYNINEK